MARAQTISHPVSDLVVYTAAIHEAILSLPQQGSRYSNAYKSRASRTDYGQLRLFYRCSRHTRQDYHHIHDQRDSSRAQTDPTISVGGILSSIHGNLRVGDSEYFISEACEYTNSFLNFRPRLQHYFKY